MEVKLDNSEDVGRFEVGMINIRLTSSKPGTHARTHLKSKRGRRPVKPTERCRPPAHLSRIAMTTISGWFVALWIRYSLWAWLIVVLFLFSSPFLSVHSHATITNRRNHRVINVTTNLTVPEHRRGGGKFLQLARRRAKKVMDTNGNRNFTTIVHTIPERFRFRQGTDRCQATHGDRRGAHHRHQHHHGDCR